MERLTHRYMDGEAYASIYKVTACGESEVKGEPIERLAVIEDGLGDNYTWADLFRLKELAQAEKDGRLVVLPTVEIYNERLEEAGYLLNVLQRSLHAEGLDTKAADRVAEIAHQEAEAALEQRKESKNGK